MHAVTRAEGHDEPTVAALGRAVALQVLREGLAPGLRGGAVSDHWVNSVRQLVRSTLYAGSEVYLREVNSLGLSYRQLSRHFTRQTGMTIKQYQIAERIREARRLLQDTTMSVTDVAHDLHYASSQKFATQFRQVTGRTPREFRDFA